MKALAVVFLFFCSLSSFSQSKRLVNEMMGEINSTLKGKGEPGKRYYFKFERKVGDTIRYESNDTTYFEVRKVLDRYVDSLPIKISYDVYTYQDLHSPNLYIHHLAEPYTGENAPGRLGPHYGSYAGIPKGGSTKFMEGVYAELRKHREHIDKLPPAEWDKPIYLLISPMATHAILKSNRFVQYLDSSLAISWAQPIYQALPLGAVAEIRLEKRFLDQNVFRAERPKRWNALIPNSYVLPEKYKNQWVRFSEQMPEVLGRVTVSFVVQPSSTELKSRITLNGDPEEASQLMDWINDLNLFEKNRNWRDYLYPKRIYFYINK